MSELRTNKIYPRNGLPVSASGGGIIQVVSVTKTDVENLTSTGTETLIPGMEATITPQSTSNKILVMITLSVMTGASFAGHYAVLRRNSTNICRGDAAGSRFRATLNLGAPHTYDNDQGIYGPGYVSMTHLDSPGVANSAVTYGIYHADVAGTENELYINRGGRDNDSTSYARTASSITLMEVSG